LLATALFAELLLNRVAARMARLDPAGPLADTFRRFDVPALFSFEFVSIFAALLLFGSLGRVILSRAERGPLRLSFALVGGVVASLALFGTFIRLSSRFAAHLTLGTLFMLLVLTLALLASPATRRWRFGMLLLVVPLALMHAANLLQRFSAPGVLDPTASSLAEAAGAAFVIAGLLSPWLLASEAGPSWFPISLSVIVAALGLTFGRLDWDFCARIAALGFGVSIPTNPAGLPLYLIGAAGFAYTIATLIPRPGPERLAGVGLLVVCLVGVQLELPYQTAASLVGLMCLLTSTTRPATDAMTRAEFDDLVKRIAGLLGANHVTVVGDEGHERARMSFAVTPELAGNLHLDRRSGALSAVELSVVVIGDRPPSVSLAARHARSLGPTASGPAIETGERDFDARYVVRDHRGAGTALLDEDTRQRIARLADGWVGVWPQRGARFRGRSLPGGDDGVPSLAQLLADLTVRSGA
jgi:hypothetical protein